MSGSGPQRELTRNKKLEAAINNEYLTRERVERLERENAVTLGRLNILMSSELQRAQRDCRFFGRIKWLFTGR